MKITVEIPSSAAADSPDGVQTIECSSETLPALLGEIEQRFPAISKHLRDDSGAGAALHRTKFTSTRKTSAFSAATITNFTKETAS